MGQVEVFPFDHWGPHLRVELWAALCVSLDILCEFWEPLPNVMQYNGLLNMGSILIESPEEILLTVKALAES